MSSNDELLALQLTSQCRMKAYMEKLTKEKGVSMEFTHNYYRVLCPADMLNITCPHMKDVPHCKFLKYTVTSTGGSYLEHATIASLFS